LFVLPSGWEGFPTVTIEAKILKKPVLATNVSGIREQMTHLKNGFIVENDENAIYEGLKFLLDNPHILETISSNEGMDSVINNEDKYNQFIKLCQ
jgi:glycosyltransferase involved in cell wall biosynthesis